MPTTFENNIICSAQLIPDPVKLYFAFLRSWNSHPCELELSLCSSLVLLFRFVFLPSFWAIYAAFFFSALLLYAAFLRLWTFGLVAGASCNKNGIMQI